MNSIPPLAFDWDGDALVPVHPRLADRHYVVGERYMLVPHQQRSAASHAHYFATLADYHASLPEDLALKHPTLDHLRKFALIMTGFRDAHTLVASSKAEALRLAAFIRPTDEFAVVAVDGCTVTRMVAQSQSMRAMGREQFQRSKSAVLEYVAAKMLGMSAEDHERHVGMAA